MIEINNLTVFSVDKTFFTGLAKKVLKGENRETENVSIAFVNSKEIQRLNKKYRKKNKPTDVLSFERVLQFNNEVSEVIICPEIVKKQSQGNKLKIELSKVLIHGILHNLGYDHEISKLEEERMFTRQDYYLSKIK